MNALNDTALALKWDAYRTAEYDERSALRAELQRLLICPVSIDGIEVGDYILNKEGTPMKVTSIVELKMIVAVNGQAVSRLGNLIGTYFWFPKPEVAKDVDQPL